MIATRHHHIDITYLHNIVATLNISFKRNLILMLPKGK